ncbi:MAG TPA: hypothetical protein VJH90_01390 [archaeon]|nr:hypothetical protein [archaeon]
MKDNGLREVENTTENDPNEIDSHYVSSVMQIVYGIDMGLEPTATIDIVMHPFAMHSAAAEMEVSRVPAEHASERPAKIGDKGYLG